MSMQKVKATPAHQEFCDALCLLIGSYSAKIDGVECVGILASVLAASYRKLYPHLSDDELSEIARESVELALDGGFTQNTVQ